jgi:hypothetical protein
VGGGRVLEEVGETIEDEGGGVEVGGGDVGEGGFPAGLPGVSLGGDPVVSLRGEAGADDAAIDLGADTLNVALIGEVVEHLGDGGGREAGGEGEVAGGEVAAILKLDEELELGVAELGGAEVGVATAETAERAKDAAEGVAELQELILAGREGGGGSAHDGGLSPMRRALVGGRGRRWSLRGSWCGGARRGGA